MRYLWDNILRYVWDMIEFDYLTILFELKVNCRYNLKENIIINIRFNLNKFISNLEH